MPLPTSYSCTGSVVSHRDLFVDLLHQALALLSVMLDGRERAQKLGGTLIGQTGLGGDPGMAHLLGQNIGEEDIADPIPVVRCLD